MRIEYRIYEKTTGQALGVLNSQFKIRNSQFKIPNSPYLRTMRSFKIALLSLFALALVFSGCKKANNGSLTIQLKARFNGQNVAFDTTRFTDKENRLVQFATLKFLVAHITLVGTDNSYHEVSPVELVDFSNPNSLTLNFNNLKGDYKAIQFGCGLDSILNDTNPLTVDVNSPLSNNNIGDMYWMWAKYTFENLSGKWDYNSDTLSVFRHGLFYLISGDSLYRYPVTLSKNLSVCCGKTTTAVLYIDLQKIFYGSTETIDIPNENGTISSTADNPVIAPAFADNFARAFTF